MAISFDPRALVELANADGELRLVARDWTATVRLDMETASFDVRFIEGKIASVDTAAAGAHPDQTLAGSSDGWARLLSATPSHPFQDLLSAQMLGGFSLEPAADPAIAAYNGVVPRLVVLLRRLVSGNDAPRFDPDPFQDTDNAIGRYVRVTVDGVDYRVFYQEAGSGVPLMLQHTAGADSRQWRHLLADPELQKRFRMIAYDLPYHGKSLPPTTGGTPWWQQEYVLTREAATARAAAISRALKLDRPVFMGCSIGGQLATDIVADYGAEFRAAVAINALYHQEPFQGMRFDWHFHPRVYKYAYGTDMYVQTAPSAPESFRREISWVYGSGGPAVYKGDNNYMVHDHDLRKNGDRIDTKRSPLYVLAGEYDMSSALPDFGGPAIPEHVPGAKYTVLEGLGHFAPAEDPLKFREQILPILDEILATTGHESEAARS